MKILVTGSQGAIGQRVMKRFPHAVGLDRRPGAHIVADLAGIDYAAPPIASILSEVRAVIHLAGPADPELPPAHHFAAVTNSARLLAACAAIPVPLVLLASSDWAEPKAPQLRINPYGHSKRVIESLAALYSSVPGQHAVALRIGWIPHDPAALDTAPDWLLLNHWSDERLFAEIDRILATPSRSG